MKRRFRTSTAARSAPGLEEWNKAFAKAGWLNALEVRQQPDDADWDPEDINYNTFRWITSNAGFAMGPSRVNPYTGQILDADIIFDADFLQFWKEEFETFTPQTVAAMTGGPLESADALPAVPGFSDRGCRYPRMPVESRDGAATGFRQRGDSGRGGQHRRDGRTAGETDHAGPHGGRDARGGPHARPAAQLQGQPPLELAGIERPGEDARGRDGVFDHGLQPGEHRAEGTPQGDYYPTTLGPYDYWAIEYAYKPLAGGTEGEVGELKKIASRSGEPALQYATDEDTGGSTRIPRPTSLTWETTASSTRGSGPRLCRKSSPSFSNGQPKREMTTPKRRASGALLGEYAQSMFFAARYVGGLETSRSHKGDKDAKPPVSLLPAEKQRAALDLLQEQVFGDKAFQFPSELYPYLAKSNWNHWGFPIAAAGTIRCTNRS